MNRASGADGGIGLQLRDEDGQVERRIWRYGDDHRCQSLKFAIAASIASRSSRSSGLAPKCRDIKIM